MLTQENGKRPVGRPRIADGEAWLEGLLSDMPKSVADIIFAAEERGISERSLTRIKGRLFRQLNDGQKGPWRAFQRGNKWFWGNEQQMPKPPKRDAFGRPIRADGSLILEEEPVPVVSRELQQMEADWAARHKQAPVVSAQPAVSTPKAKPFWEDRELWSSVPSMTDEVLERHMDEIFGQPNWYDNPGMLECYTLLQTTQNKRKQEKAQ